MGAGEGVVEKPATAARASDDQAQAVWLPLLPLCAGGLCLGVIAGRGASGLLVPALLAAGLSAWWLWRGLQWRGRVALFLAALLIGSVCRAPPEDPQMLRLIEESALVERFHYGGYSQGVRLRLASGARTFARLPPAPPVRVGDRLAVRGLWRCERYRAAWSRVLVVEEVRVVCPREAGPRGWAWRAIGRLRVHPDLAAALLLGQERPPERAVFQDAGLAHILAVSGFHVGIALLGLAWLLSLVPIDWRLRQAALASWALAYLWLTAAPLPTQRAVIMALALLVGGSLARAVHRSAGLALAMLILLLLDRQDPTRLGFQLSVVAVAGILSLGLDLVAWRRAWLPLRPWPLDRWLWRGLLALARSTFDGLAIGLAATLATAPVLAWHLGTGNPWSVCATLLATPLLMLILFSGLPWLLLAGWWPAGPWGGLAWLCECGLQMLCTLATWISGWPGASLQLPAPAWWIWPLWIALLLGPRLLIRRRPHAL